MSDSNQQNDSGALASDSNPWIYDPLVGEVVPYSNASLEAKAFHSGPSNDFGADDTSDQSERDESNADDTEVNLQEIDAIPF